MTVQQLRNLLVDDVSVEELILAKAALETLDRGYQDLGIETPEWVVDKVTAVARELVAKNEAEMERKYRTLMARRESLATAEEKRQKIDTELASLKEKLGK